MIHIFFSSNECLRFEVFCLEILSSIHILFLRSEQWWDSIVYVKTCILARVSLKKPKNPWISPEMHIGFLITKHVLHFLYNACGKWYFQSKISPFGLIQAGHTKLENEVSLSMGIVEKIWNMFYDQGANVYLWLNSRMFWFFRLTLLSIHIMPKVST